MVDVDTYMPESVSPSGTGQSAGAFPVAKVNGFGAQGRDAEWQRYCGFLDLNIDQFMEVQARLLEEQIDLIHATPLGKQLFRGRRPSSMEEFRQTVPLTTYGDYVAALSSQDDAVLGNGPLVWAHTTGAQAGYKWVPYTRRGFERALDNLMACFILASANEKGQVNVGPGSTVLYNTPERPYLSGLITFGMTHRFGFNVVLDPAASEVMDFRDRIREGFRQALSKKVDVVVSMTSVLAKIGEEFSRHSRRTPLGPHMLAPRALSRLSQALFRRKVLRQEVLPRHLWPTKAIIGWGMDTPYFREKVEHYWGCAPFEAYACTEGGIMGMQSWARRGMIFSPYADFYEFIPLEESLRRRTDDRVRLATVLLNEVKQGQTYELVLTNFYGMALARYRVGHYVQFLAGTDESSALPEFRLIERADERIDLAGFTRVDEKTVWEALRRIGIEHQDWTVRKEAQDGKLLVHMYLEIKDGRPAVEIESSLHEAFCSADAFYRDLEGMLGIRPLRVTALAPGTFERFYELRRQKGHGLGQRTPPRINPMDEDIRDLLTASASGAMV